MKFIVKHPNFDNYLFMLQEPVTKTYSYDDVTETQRTVTHTWKSDPAEATQFDTIHEALNNAPSKLCGIFKTDNGCIVEQITVSY